MEIIESSEIYVWLGKMLNTHFFIHTVSSDEWNENISLGLYNCLIHNKFINFLPFSKIGWIIFIKSVIIYLN